MKNIHNVQDKMAALEGKFSINDSITDGCWDAIIIDDLYDTGSSMIMARLRTH